MLSNLALQAEYGNHQEHHTVEYLKRLISFPKGMIAPEDLPVFTEYVIQRRKMLHNVSQSKFFLMIFCCLNFTLIGCRHKNTIDHLSEKGLKLIIIIIDFLLSNKLTTLLKFVY